MEELESSVKEAQLYLENELRERETLLKKGREILLSCSRAIVLMHSDKKKHAKEEIARAETMLEKIRKKAMQNQRKYLIQVEQEFAEARILFSLLYENRFPSSNELGISHESYLLGLLDCVGELKRKVLDLIMKNDIEHAAFFFERMQKIYSLCLPLSVYDNVLPGIRRKIDIARILLEDTRGFVVDSIGREQVSEKVGRK